MENIILKLKEYFESHLKNKVFIFDTYKHGSIIVRCKSFNFAHLIGKEKSTNLNILSIPAERYYNSIGNKGTDEYSSYKLESAFSLIDEDRYNNNQLVEDEFFILNKIMYFIDLFDSLERSNGSQMRIYNKKSGDLFDADFLHLHILDDLNHIGYIGIIGSESEDCYWFNSIYIDSSNAKRGTPIPIKKFTIIDEDEYDNYYFEKIYPSRRKIRPTKSIGALNKGKQFKLNKQTVNKINKMLVNGYSLTKGNGKATQYYLTLNKNILIHDFQNEEFEKSVDGAIKWINEKYPLSKKEKVAK